MSLYCDHATSEQFHSEFKTDLDIERLPSGKFATNDLVMACATLSYNILRWIGLVGLLRDGAPIRHKAKRRRISRSELLNGERLLRAHASPLVFTMVKSVRVSDIRF